MVRDRRRQAMNTTLDTLAPMPEIVRYDPPYKLVAEHLRQSIRSGERKPGDVMPTTQELTKEYGVAMSTAARALALLRDEKWIVTRPSKAALVAPRQPKAR